MLELYGEDAYKINAAKAKKTNLERYGVDNVGKTDESIFKSLETRLHNGTLNSFVHYKYDNNVFDSIYNTK